MERSYTQRWWAVLKLIISHVSGRGTEFGVGLDDFVDGLQKVLLGSHLSTGAYRKHTRLCTDRTNLSTYA